MNEVKLSAGFEQDIFVECDRLYVEKNPAPPMTTRHHAHENHRKEAVMKKNLSSLDTIGRSID